MPKNNEKVDWEAVDAKFPTAATPAGQAARKEIFDTMDTSRNGILTLTEIQSYLPSLVQHDLAFLDRSDNCRKAVKCAFTASKGLEPQPQQKKRRGRLKPDMVGRSEFHALLVAFRIYLELDILFEDIDTTDNRMLCYKECIRGIKLLDDWGIDKADLRRKFPDEWTESMKFDQFADWLIMKRFKTLDLQLDENDPMESLLEAACEGDTGVGGTILAAFTRWDSDGSGCIKEEELAAVLEGLDPKFTLDVSNKLFQAADANRDGKIDYAEFSRWLTANDA